MLDAATTVMAIWPAPMIYGGPTEVLFHAKSRRNAGATYFVAGRDPAGMKGSELAQVNNNNNNNTPFENIHFHPTTNIPTFLFMLSTHSLHTPSNLLSLPLSFPPLLSLGSS